MGLLCFFGLIILRMDFICFSVSFLNHGFVLKRFLLGMGFLLIEKDSFYFLNLRFKRGLEVLLWLRLIIVAFVLLLSFRNCLFQIFYLQSQHRFRILQIFEICCLKRDFSLYSSLSMSFYLIFSHQEKRQKDYQSL